VSLDSQKSMTNQPTPAEALSAPSVVGRRRLLVGGAVATMAAALAACGTEEAAPAPTTPIATPETTEREVASVDLDVAELAAGLEVLAVQTYTAALGAATSGALGEVPPAVAEFVTTAKAHHEQHLDAWNTVLSGAGRPEVTEPNADLKPTVDEELAGVSDVAGAANLALTLEQIASQTYLKAIPTLQSEDAIRTAASIQVVDQQHQSILLYALGMYPVPEVFQSTDKAVGG